LLPEALAEEVWRVDNASVLLATRADAFSDGSRWTLDSEGRPEIDFGVFGTAAAPVSGEAQLQRAANDGIFQHYKAILPEVTLLPKITKVREAVARGPWMFGTAVDWRPAPTPMAPDEAEWAGAARWRIEVPSVPRTATVSDAFLKITYQGDVARLYRGQQLLDDNFWNGAPWTIGLREVAESDQDWRSANIDMELRLLPLPRTFPMYFDETDKLPFGAAGVADSLTDVQVVLQYRLVLESTARK